MQAVSDQAVGVGLVRGVKPDQQLVKVVVSLSIAVLQNEVRRN